MRFSRDAGDRALAWSSAAIVVAAVACGGGNQREVDAGPPVDAPLGPGLIVSVSTEGNDAHDGITQPVETLKRAVAIATANPQVTDIVLATGRYTMRQGEAFPYTLPPNVIGLAGPPGGGAVLVGTGAETGLILKDGQIQDIELDNFAVAIDGAGSLRLKNLRVAASMIGIHGAEGATLRIDNLDISGGAGRGCATGIKLDGVAELTVTTFTTHDLGTAVDALNHSSQKFGAIDISDANLTSTLGATCVPGVLSVMNQGLTLSGSMVDGGSTGIEVSGSGSPPSLPVKITNTTVRNLQSGLLINGAVARIASSAITDNVTGFQGASGSWSLTNVTISRNSVGIVLSGDTVNGPSLLTMRGCAVAGHTNNGIELFDYTDADLGTTASPGNNLFTSNVPVGLLIGGPAGTTQIDAVGNTWVPNVQDADALGHYPTVATVTGPIGSVFGNNFAIASGWSLKR
jgi:hypothetical protein